MGFLARVRRRAGWARFAAICVGVVLLASLPALIGSLLINGADDAEEAEANRLAFGHPGAPPLLPHERLASIGTLAGVGGGPAEQTELLPGVRGVEYVAQCNQEPASKHERNPDPGAYITVHTTEEMAGPDAVCRYHNGLWRRVAYHYYIGQNGTIYRLLPHESRPYAQKSRNSGITITLQGRANVNIPNEAQRSATHRLVAALAKVYPTIGPEDIYSHHDWTVKDQAEVRAGTFRHDASLANDHTDVGKNWSPNKWGLPALVKAIREPGNTPRPSADGTSPSTGTATWYGDAFHGKVMRCGAIYDQTDPHTTAVYLVGTQPAWPCGTILRVTEATSGRHVDVAVTDTGLFQPPHLVDLSRAAFLRLAPTSRGRVDVSVRVVGRDDASCRYVIESNPEGEAPFAVCHGFRAPYFEASGGGHRVHGFPTTPMIYEPDGLVWQRFSRGSVFLYRPERGVWIERPSS